ncbi:hypothetical protein [Paenilisteria newyorkensis]|uniref:hypothetical protein n=1 Tax=Listeria newyorkensis TaxID=1497681 RepID=UPI00066A0ED3|nr:hypothetical protein [Listeria newyorkensis]KMT63288.1 hypothetical protein X559_0361 [Listeria newyorkensis]
MGLNQLFSEKLAAHGATASHEWNTKKIENERNFSPSDFEKAKKNHDQLPLKPKNKALH